MTHPFEKLMQTSRRSFHRVPEEGWTEFQTTARIIESLRELDFTVLSGSRAINPSFIRGRDENWQPRQNNVPGMPVLRLNFWMKWRD